MTSAAAPDAQARRIVWGVWAGMLALLLWSWLPIASRVPLAEDWYTVPLVTRQPVDLGAWLWEQNNEHRMPVARLLLLGVLKASGGDYRAGGLLNLALLAAGAAGLVRFARRLRGGVTDPADAFFPLTLLHFGHSVDVLFPFQITFVLSLGIIITAGCALFVPTSPRAAVVAGSALLLLPLSGFLGLLFVPPLAGYLAFAGWHWWRGSGGWPRHRSVGAWLLAASAGAVLLGALYFAGYEPPSWNPPNPGIVPSAKVVLKVFALGFGAAPFFWWLPFVAAAVPFLGASCWQAWRHVDRSGPSKGPAAGAVVFLLAALGFAAGAGWGRAGYVPEIGIPLRYVSLVLPAFVAAYLTWVVSPSRASRLVPRALALALLILLPFNTMAGHRFFADWYAAGMRALHADIDSGVPLDELAVRHQPFLVHWWSPAQLAERMRMLHEAGVAPFDRAGVSR